jgi:hypothetical protein
MTDDTMEPLEPPHYKLNSAAQEEIRKRLFPNYPDKAQISEFFEVLGRAVTVWQLVETALYEVYERTVAPYCPETESTLVRLRRGGNS